MQESIDVNDSPEVKSNVESSSIIESKSMVFASITKIFYNNFTFFILSESALNGGGLLLYKTLSTSATDAGVLPSVIDTTPANTHQEEVGKEKITTTDRQPRLERRTFVHTRYTVRMFVVYRSK